MSVSTRCLSYRLFRLLVLLTIFWLGPSARAAKHALLIGIDEYENKDAMSSLSAAAADAQALGKTLTEVSGFPPDNVRLLASNAGTKPTRNNILYEIELLTRQVKPGDLVFVLYSGHGTELGTDSFLLPYDVDPRSEFLMRRSSIPTRDFTEALGALTGVNLVLAFDMCRNNPFKGGDRAATSPTLTNQQARDLVLKPAQNGAGVRAAITLFACSIGQRSWEWKDKKRGFFSYYLEQGLRSGKGRIGELVDYLENEVPRAVQRETNQKQIPWSKMEGTGALNLALGRPSAAPLPPARISEGQTPEAPRLEASIQVSTKINPKDGAEMVRVQAGEFQMGSSKGSDDEKPQRQVYLDDFWMYKNLVTVAQYRRFCTATQRQLPDAPAWGWKDDHPMVNVTFEDAKAYSDWAGTSLPTEAQWEKAARGVDGREYPWGNEFSMARLWSSKKGAGDARSTAPVGSFPLGSSLYGALDMAGNVWQWCADWYSEDYYKQAPIRNPMGPGFDQNQSRVIRGGCWADFTSQEFRSANRFFFMPANRDDCLGFRCVQGIR